MGRLDNKIEITVGCAEFLTQEVTRNRRDLELLGAENRVMNNFFGMIDRIGDKSGGSCSPDQFYQARREIEEAIKDSEGPTK